VSKEPDGTVRIHQKTVLPADSPDPPVQNAVFGSPVQGNTVVDGGSFGGVAYKSSGILSAEPPGTVSYRLTFTRAGTYQLRCLIHPDMKAQIKVG
jgi:plastocyanin